MGRQKGKKILGILSSVIFFSILAILILNVNQPSVVIQQTYQNQTTGGSVTVITKSCNGILIPSTSICGASGNSPTPVQGTTPSTTVPSTTASVVVTCSSSQFLYGSQCFNNGVTAFVNPVPNNGCPTGYFVSGTSCIINPTNTTNQSNSNTITCSNGGTPINGVCPTSITQLPSNTTLTPPVQIPVVSTVVSTITKPQPLAPENIQITPLITAIDDSGQSHVLQSQSSGINLQLNSFLKALSFISLPNTNYLIDHGTIRFGIQIKASPNEFINANGTLYGYANGQKLTPTGLFWYAKGMTDASGNIVATINNPAQLLSYYSIDIFSNFANPTNTKNQINITMSQVQVQNGKGQSYSNALFNQNNFEMQFASVLFNYNQYGTIQVINGNNVIVYPNDDSLTIAYQYNPTNPASYIASGSGSNYHVIQVLQNPVAGGVATATSNGKQIGLTLTNLGTIPFSSQYTISWASDTAPDLTCSGYINTPNGFAFGGPAIVHLPWNSTITFSFSGGYKSFSQTVQTPAHHAQYYYICNANSCSMQVLDNQRYDCYSPGVYPYG